MQISFLHNLSNHTIFKGIGIVSFANRTYAPMGALNTKILELLLKENEILVNVELNSLLENTAQKLTKIIVEDKSNLASYMPLSIPLISNPLTIPQNIR
jgi:hypothetical protein